MRVLSQAGTWQLLSCRVSYENFWNEIYPVLEKADVPFHFWYVWADYSAVDIFLPLYCGDYNPPEGKWNEFLKSGLSVFFD